MRLPVLIIAVAIAMPVGGYQDIRSVEHISLSPAPEPDLSMVPEQYREVIARAANQAGVPARILAGIAYAESNFQSAPAHRDPLDRGMFGIREAPGYHEERARAYGEFDAEIPEQAVHVAAGLLRDHLERFDGYLPLALTAYHRGAGWAEKNGVDWEYVGKVGSLWA